jgi:ATP-dependent Lon protease
MRYEDLITVDISLVPISKRSFESNLPNNTNLSKWAGHLVLPICFAYEGKQLDVGYLCTVSVNHLMPVGRLLIDHENHELNPCEWEDTNYSNEAMSLFSVLEAMARVQGYTEKEIELADTIADRNIVDLATKVSYITASIEVAIALAITILSKKKNEIYPNIPEYLNSYLAHEAEKLNSLATPPDEKRYIANYLQNVSKIPWDKYGVPRTDPDRIMSALDTSHFGLPDTKSSLVDLLHLYKTSSHLPMAILLSGPPSVGKTSLMRSLANAVGLPFHVIPMGGMHDTNILFGFTRTYRDSKPGRISQCLVASKVMNPIILLDEIDKTTPDIQNQLLHVLDPDHRDMFVDNYFGFPIDLTRVIFVATANDLNHISEALLRRLMVFEIPFYNKEERELLIKNYIFPALQRKMNISGYTLDSEALRELSHITKPGILESTLYKAIAKAHLNQISMITLKELSMDPRPSRRMVGY